MTTQLESEAKISKIINGMNAQGVPRLWSTAVGMAIEHALTCPEFAKVYGTWLQSGLQEFVDEVYTS